MMRRVRVGVALTAGLMVIVAVYECTSDCIYNIPKLRSNLKAFRGVSMDDGGRGCSSSLS